MAAARGGGMSSASSFLHNSFRLFNTLLSERLLEVACFTRVLALRRVAVTMEPRIQSDNVAQPIEAAQAQPPSPLLPPHLRLSPAELVALGEAPIKPQERSPS